MLAIVAGAYACSFGSAPQPTARPPASPFRLANTHAPLKATATDTPTTTPTLFTLETAQALLTQLAAPPPTEMAAPTRVIDPLTCLPPGAAKSTTGEIGLVSWIPDGQTIVVDFQGRRDSVRLLGLDAPPIAVRALQTLLENQVVRIFRDPSGDFARDGDGTPFGYVLTVDGSFINYQMLHIGEARLNERLQGFACQEIFSAAQAAAKTAAIGLWGVQAAAALPTITSPPPSPPPPATVIAALPPTATLAQSATVNPGATLASATPTFTVGPGTTQPTASSPSPTTPSQTGTVTITTVSPTSGSPATTNPPPPPPPASTPTATPSGEGASDVDVEISNIYWSGTPAKSESDEYIELHNRGASAFDLSGWSVYAEDTFAEAVFPNGFSLAAGAYCRVYTNEVRPDSCGGIKFNEPQEIWPNDYSCGGLYSPKPEEENIAYYCY